MAMPADARSTARHPTSEFVSTVPGSGWMLSTAIGTVTVALTLVFITQQSWEIMLAGPALGLVVIVPVAVLTRRAMQLTLRIGDDGVHFAPGGVRRLFPIDTLESCSVVEVFELAEGLELVRRDGSTERIAFPSLATGDLGRREEPARGAALAIEAAIARFRARERSPHDRADLRLARHGETTLQWVTSLRRAARAATSYRDSASSPDDVLAVLDDPAAPPSMRVAAALAIEGEPARRERVRVAAEQTADPELAAALRLVLVDAAPEKLPEALDALEAGAGPLRDR